MTLKLDNLRLFAKTDQTIVSIVEWRILRKKHKKCVCNFEIDANKKVVLIGIVNFRRFQFSSTIETFSFRFTMPCIDTPQIYSIQFDSNSNFLSLLNTYSHKEIVSQSIEAFRELFKWEGDNS